MSSPPHPRWPRFSAASRRCSGVAFARRSATCTPRSPPRRELLPRSSVAHSLLLHDLGAACATSLTRRKQMPAEMDRSARILAAIGVGLALFLAALDQTIVGTALPRIVGEL